jgi:hypothetical protein
LKECKAETGKGDITRGEKCKFERLYISLTGIVNQGIEATNRRWGGVVNQVLIDAPPFIYLNVPPN